MSFRFALAAVTLAIASTLVHCASETDGPSGPDDAGPSAVTDLDASVDANADADAAADADAELDAAEEEFEIPDGAVDCNDPHCVTAITGGFGIKSTAAYCALLRDKSVQCWGTNQLNRLGYAVDGGALPYSPSPHRVPSLSDVTSLSVAGDNACVTDSSGKVTCWGAADLVKAGLDPDGGALPTTSAFPTELDLVPAASTVAVGAKGTACIRTEAGTITCWGKSDTAQLAKKTNVALSPPTAIPIERTDLIPWPGQGWMFAATSTGALYSWGASDCASPYHCKYLLGRDSSEALDPRPTLVAGMSKVRGLASSAKHVCAIVGRTVECWGGNDLGQLGRGYVGDVSELPGPTLLDFAAALDDADAGVQGRVDVPLQVVADTSRTCVVMGSGRIFCWGSIGTDRTTWGHPAKVEGLTGPVVGLALAVTSSCALLRSGVVECWGGNLFGALGRGISDITFNDPAPAPVEFPEE